MHEGKELMKTYDVTVTREGRWWMVEIPELDGLTQARRLDEVETMAREYIAVTLDVALSKVAVDVSGIEVDGQDWLSPKTLVGTLRKQAQEVEDLAAAITREIAATLTQAKVPLRDVSSVLGLSHQRVSQIVHGPITKARATESGRVVLAEAQRANRRADLVIQLENGSVLEVELKNAGSTRKPVRKPMKKPAAKVARSKPRGKSLKATPVATVGGESKRIAG